MQFARPKTITAMRNTRRLLFCSINATKSKILINQLGWGGVVDAIQLVFD
jgi:hypothetical protein